MGYLYTLDPEQGVTIAAAIHEQVNRHIIDDTNTSNNAFEGELIDKVTKKPASMSPTMVRVCGENSLRVILPIKRIPGRVGLAWRPLMIRGRVPSLHYLATSTDLTVLYIYIYIYIYIYQSLG